MMIIMGVIGLIVLVIVIGKFYLFLLLFKFYLFYGTVLDTHLGIPLGYNSKLVLVLVLIIALEDLSHFFPFRSLNLFQMMVR